MFLVLRINSGDGCCSTSAEVTINKEEQSNLITDLPTVYHVEYVVEDTVYLPWSFVVHEKNLDTTNDINSNLEENESKEEASETSNSGAIVSESPQDECHKDNESTVPESENNTDAVLLPREDTPGTITPEKEKTRKRRIQKIMDIITQ